MDRKFIYKMLGYAAGGIRKSIEDTRFLFHNLGLDPDEMDAAQAEKAGMKNVYYTMIHYEKELEAIRNAVEEMRRPRQWRVIKAGGLGSVYICPLCDKKSPEKFDFCPHCGERVNGGDADAKR